METDKNLHRLLNEGAILKASADFTQRVMTNIEAIAKERSIVTTRVKLAFKIMVTAIVSALIVLSFLINPTSIINDAFSQIWLIPFNYQVMVAEYLLAFWALIALSVWMNKGLKQQQSV